MKVFYAKDITDGMTEDVMNDWQEFLKELRFFAKRHMMTFDPRDIQKSNLDKRDFEFMAKENMTEARSSMFGSRRSSFQTLDKTKLIIRHSKNVDEEVPGSRSRSIKALFIENGEGERFKYPFKHLAGARAMQHTLPMVDIHMITLDNTLLICQKVWQNLEHLTDMYHVMT